MRGAGGRLDLGDRDRPLASHSRPYAERHGRGVQPRRADACLGERLFDGRAPGSQQAGRAASCGPQERWAGRNDLWPWRTAHGCRLSSRRKTDRNLELGSNDQALGRPRGSGEQSLLGHRDWVLHVEFSPTGHRLATGGADGAIKIWDCEAGRTLMIARPQAECHLRGFDPDGRGWRPPAPTRQSRSGTLQPTPRCSPGEAAGRSVRLAFFPDGAGCSWPGTSRTGRSHSSALDHPGYGDRECMTSSLADGAPSDRPIDGIAVSA